MRLVQKIALAAIIAFPTTSMAGECLMSITRTPCPGKEAEALKPYDGKGTTEEKKKVDSADACGKAAEKAAKIVRKGVLSAKSVDAKFDGAAVTGSPFADKASCS